MIYQDFFGHQQGVIPEVARNVMPIADLVNGCMNTNEDVPPTAPGGATNAVRLQALPSGETADQRLSLWVEDPHQAARLAISGATVIQHYLTGKPIVTENKVPEMTLQDQAVSLAVPLVSAMTLGVAALPITAAVLEAEVGASLLGFAAAL